MTLTQIEVFVTIAKLGNFTKAGEELGMSQSAVSHSVSKLEDYLNTKLFQRSKTGVYLTPMGESIYEYMDSIMKNLLLVENEVKSTIKLSATTLKIGAFQSISISILPKVFKLFKQIYPQIDFVLFEGTEHEIIEWIENDTIDLGFITLPHEKYDSVFIIQDEILVVLPEKHKLAKYKSIEIDELKNEDLIMPIDDCDILRSGKTKELLLDVKYRISNLNTILEMVKEQLGITIFPKLTINNTTNERLSTCSFNPPLYRKIGIISKEKISDSTIKRIFMEKTKHIVKINKLM